MNEAEKELLELLNSLKTINEFCKKNDDCEECPMGNENCECEIRNSNPDNWKINKRTVIRLL